MLTPTTTHYITQSNVNQFGYRALVPVSDLEAPIKIGNERIHTIGRLDNFFRFVVLLLRGKNRGQLKEA